MTNKKDWTNYQIEIEAPGFSVNGPVGLSENFLETTVFLGSEN